MTFTELSWIEQQERELQKKLKELKEKKTKLVEEEQAKKKYSHDWDLALAENTKREEGLAIEIFKVENDVVYIRNPYDDHMLTALRSIRGRMWERANYGNDVNSIPINEWTKFLKSVEHINENHIKTTLHFEDGTKETIDAWINQPRLSIDLSENERDLILTPHKGEDWLARQISGIRYTRKDHYLLAASEIWKAIEVLKSEPGIEWSERAKAYLDKEISRRETLDKIALGQDVQPLEVELTDKSVQFRPFQEIGVRFLEATEYRALLADQMGLGKTLQAIAACMLVERDVNPNARFLVLCPAGLKTNWTREIFRFTGHRPYVMFGSEPGREDVKKLLLEKEKWNIINYDIIGRKAESSEDVTTADGRVIRTQIKTRYLWAEMINLSEFDVIILDEGHYIKNTESQRSVASRELKAPRVICMTGTPVLNRPGELWPMLNLIAPEKFASYQQFLSTYTWNGKDARNVKELREALKTLMIRRTKKEVMADLPPINRIYEWHSLSDEAKIRYNQVLKGVYEALAKWEPDRAGTQQEVTNILTEIMRLKQVCAQDKIEATADLAIALSDADDNGGKVLIFTQFKAVAKNIATRLGHEALLYYGEMNKNERDRTYDEYVKSPTKKFLIATWQTAGEGLNLQCANNVIFSDLFWTPANHQQCEERAYGRLADPHPINSYYVVCEGTVEDWIQEILDRKLAVIEQVVEGLDTERTQSVANELMRKMKRELKLL